MGLTLEYSTSTTTMGTITATTASVYVSQYGITLSDIFVQGQIQRIHAIQGIFLPKVNIGKNINLKVYSSISAIIKNEYTFSFFYSGKEKNV